jgi:hypothetical protein
MLLTIDDWRLTIGDSQVVPIKTGDGTGKWPTLATFQLRFPYLPVPNCDFLPNCALLAE